MSRSQQFAIFVLLGLVGAGLAQQNTEHLVAPTTARQVSASSVTAGNPGADTMTGSCAGSLVDQSTGNCIVANSVPALGQLYPMSPWWNVQPTTGNVGINTADPATKLHVDQSGAFIGYLRNIRSSIDSTSGVALGTLGIESTVRGPCVPYGGGNKAMVATAVATSASAEVLNVGIEASASGNAVNLAGWFPEGAVAIGGLSALGFGLPTSWPDGLMLFVEGDGTAPSNPLLPGAEAMIVARDNSAELGLFSNTKCALYFGRNVQSGSPSGGAGAVYYEHASDWLGFRTAFVDRDVGIDRNGRLGVGTRNPSESLSVVGNICATGTIGTCSDARYKTEVRELEGGLSTVEKLRGIRFHWRAEEFPDRQFSSAEQIGFLAQEVAEVLPEVASIGSDGYYTLDYGRLTPVLVEAIQEQQTEIVDLQAKLSRLEQFEAEIQELKGAISSLSSQR